MAAVAVVAGGSAFAVSLGGGPDRVASTKETSVQGPHWVPVVVGGHFHVVDGTVLGPEGPAVGALVGTTPRGVVVVTGDESLVLIDEQSGGLEPLVPGKVVRARLAGDSVAYQNRRGVIRWQLIEPSADSDDYDQTRKGLLEAASGDRVVVAAGPDGSLVSYDVDGPHELVFERPPNAIHQVETSGDVIAVRADDLLVFFDPEGRQTEEVNGGERIGALAPDGHAYAQAEPSRRGVQLVDPASADATLVEGPAGPISDIGWAPDGDLLVVVDADGSRTLWRCSPDGSGCAPKVEDPSGTLHLGQVTS